MTKPTRPGDYVPVIGPPVTIGIPQISTPLQNAPAFAPFTPSGGGGSSTVIPLIMGRRTVRLIIPPGGFAGFAQQTPATQALFQRAGRVGGQRSAAKRRAKRKKTAAKTTTRRRKRTSKRARLVKGSAAAKRYMASIRRKRKR